MLSADGAADESVSPQSGIRRLQWRGGSVREEVFRAHIPNSGRWNWFSPNPLKNQTRSRIKFDTYVQRRAFTRYAGDYHP
jgi:hypothetical protein